MLHLYTTSLEVPLRLVFDPFFLSSASRKGRRQESPPSSPGKEEGALPREEEGRGKKEGRERSVLCFLSPFPPRSESLFPRRGRKIKEGRKKNGKAAASQGKKVC